MNKHDFRGINMINYSADTTMEDAPIIRKLGLVRECLGEMTPIVFHHKLLLITTEHAEHYGLLYDPDTQEVISTFGKDREYFSAYCENDVIYAFGTHRSKEGEPDSIYMYVSSDGLNWEEHFLFSRPGFSFFNTSVCKGPDGYRMALEIASDNKKLRWEPDYYNNDPIIGHPFTEFFLKSNDLYHWQWLPDEVAYGKDRYVACPAMRWSEGYYYLICLEELPHNRYAPYIVRTKDFETRTWEIGYHNPVLMYSQEDRIPKAGLKFTEEQLAQFRSYFNINDCDVDLCEFEGKTYLFYMTGNQLGTGYTCEAVYDGPINAFFKAFFR